MAISGRSSQEGIKRTGDMMLTGWKMLSRSCPICTFPLMGKDTKLHCPGCNIPVIMDESEISTNSQYYAGGLATIPENSMTLGVAAEGSSKDENTDDFQVKENKIERNIQTLKPSDNILSAEHIRKEFDISRVKMNEVSAKLGDRMLAGWTLLASHCSNDACKGTKNIIRIHTGS